MTTRASRALAYLVATTLLAGGLVITWSLPPDARPLDELGEDPDALFTVRGAFHVHTTRSDGEGTLADVAEAARRAGLQFVVLTDHGDGTSPRLAPRYEAGVLVVDGVEISTDAGHYLAIDLPSAPYPLGGDPDGVIEDVRRLGGFGVVAHPSSKETDLAWRAGDTGFDGIEWLNGDSAWRDESPFRLASSSLTYLFWPTSTLVSLLDKPVEALRRWDQASSWRPVVGLAGSDAHTLINYEQMFRVFSVHVVMSEAWSRNAAADARLLIDGIRNGRVFTAIEAIAQPAGLTFFATRGGDQRFRMGDRMSSPQRGDGTTLYARTMAEDSTTSLWANGKIVAEAMGRALRYEVPPTGSDAAYRVEVALPRAPGHPPVPWIVSSPIYIGATTPVISASQRSPAVRTDDPPLDDELLDNVVGEEGAGTEPWTIEHDPHSTASVGYDEGRLRFSYALAEQASASSPYAALVRSIEVGRLRDYDSIRFRVTSNHPVRISLQVRAGKLDGYPRWRTSFYADTFSREVAIPFDALRSVESWQDRLRDRSAIDSLLFVADLVNSERGGGALVELSQLRLVSSGQQD